MLEADQRGCQLDRKMDDLIRAAGFQINSIKTCHMAEALDIVRAVDRDLQDDHAPPHMDRHSNPGKLPWHAGAKDIRLRIRSWLSETQAGR